MKKKYVNINRLILYDEKCVKIIIEELEKKWIWIKLKGNIYYAILIGFYTKIQKDNNKYYIDIWKQHFPKIITRCDYKYFGFLYPLAIKNIINKWIKKIKKHDPNCKITQTTTQMLSNSGLIMNIIIVLGILFICIIAFFVKLIFFK